MVYVVSRDNKGLSDKIISAVRQNPRGMEAALKSAENTLRAMMHSEPAAVALVPGRRYGVLGISPFGFAWRNGRQVPNQPEIYLYVYEYTGRALRSRNVWGSYTDYAVRPQMVLFEL